MEEWLNGLETPCIVIDMDRARENILRMQRAADAAGCALRPHIKTHKMPLFAKMQVEAGAKGITCAKVSEAEVMADGGLDDIFIAYPLMGDIRVRRAIALSRRVRRLILAVDSLAGARYLSGEARREHVMLEVRLEIDTGAGRTGVALERAAGLAVQVAELPGLRLTGVYTFKGLVYQGAPCADVVMAAREEGELMAGVARLIREAGVGITEVSAGSTPTGVAVAQTGLVSEIRPGTYLFNDELLVAEGAAAREEIAARYFVTVVSTPCREYAVVDGGTKTFSCDIPIGTAPYRFPGYAVPVGKSGLRLARMNEEHGMLAADGGDTGLAVGEKIALNPIHVCTAINLQNSVYLLQDGVLRKERVAARGMLV